VTHGERAALIARLEADARRNPAAYRRRVVLLAFAGYAYLVCILLGSLALVALLVFLGLSARNAGLLLSLSGPVLAFALLILRGLWVRFEEPLGLRLDRNRFPHIHGLVEETRVAVRAPRVHEVLLTGEAGASMAQRPRLGVFGWPRNSLLLGLPLLDGVTAEEARAVLAHELGHLSAADGFLSSWIYRTRASWARLMERLRTTSHPGAGVLRPFFQWYAPLFDAYSFVAARAQERAADAWSRRLAGSEASASALVRIELLQKAVGERYWPAVFERSQNVAEPDRRPFGEMVERLPSALDACEASRALEASLDQETTHDDTHPCTRERLKILGQRPHLPGPVGEPASVVFFGPDRAAVASTLDEWWRAGVRGQWRRAFREARAARSRLVTLDATAGRRPLSAPEAFERAQLHERFSGPDDALPLYRAVAEAHPAQRPARYCVARILLVKDQEEGLELLRPFFATPPEAVAPAHRLAEDYLRRRGRAEGARRHARQAQGRERKMRAAVAERAQLRPLESLVPHGLPGEPVDVVRKLLEEFRDVRRVWLVRREVVLLKEWPLYLLFVERRAPLFTSSRAKRERNQPIASRVLSAGVLPGQTSIWFASRLSFGLRRALGRVPGSQILPRR
jgi:Zn-dependent protease with chaperone function